MGSGKSELPTDKQAFTTKELYDQAVAASLGEAQAALRRFNEQLGFTPEQVRAAAVSKGIDVLRTKLARPLNENELRAARSYFEHVLMRFYDEILSGSEIYPPSSFSEDSEV